MAAAERSAVPGEQRIFSLVLALVASPHGATRHELLSSVYGYADRYRPGGDNVAIERQFERDKEQLRALGIQIETLDPPDETGDNKLTRYRISKERLEFPASLRFTERELMLLRLAALAWSEGSRGTESRRAVMKLESLGAGLDVQHLGVAPVLGAVDAAAPVLQRAIDRGVVAHFEYALPGKEVPLARVVAPLRLHRLEHRWHLIAWDLERDEARVFLLSRISGAVRTGSAEFEAALRDRADAAVAALVERAASHTARLAVRPGTAAEARLAPRAREAVVRRGDDEPREIVVSALDHHELADELVGYGDEVLVIEPAELRELVASRLTQILLAHGGELDA